MSKAAEWHRRQLVTSDAEAERATETFRRTAGWTYVPLPALRKVLYEWFRRGWCLAAIQRAWEITPDDRHQRRGDPDADPLGTLEVRLDSWRDGLKTPLDPPVPASTAEDIERIQARRRDELGSGRAGSARRRETIVRHSREEAARRAEQRLHDRIGAIRARDRSTEDNLAALARITGTETSSFPVPDEQQYRSDGDRRHQLAREEALDASGHRAYLEAMADKIARDGLASLTREEKAVLRNRLASLRAAGSQAELDSYIRDFPSDS